MKTRPLLFRQANLKAAHWQIYTYCLHDSLWPTIERKYDATKRDRLKMQQFIFGFCDVARIPRNFNLLYIATKDLFKYKIVFIHMHYTIDGNSIRLNTIPDKDLINRSQNLTISCQSSQKKVERSFENHFEKKN